MPEFAGSSSASSDSPMGIVLRLLLDDAANAGKKDMSYLFSNVKTNPESVLRNMLFLRNFNN